MKRDLVQYTLQLADNALVLGHRNSEWCGHGPVLEQDIAISNIALDLIGQARNFYQYAAATINENRELFSEEIRRLSNHLITEDSLAYFRDATDFRNIVLVEQPKGDWAVTILRQFFFSAFQQLLCERLKTSDDKQLAAIAEKSTREIAYHLRWSSEWVIRLGDGTTESRSRMLNAVDALWSYTPDFFSQATYEISLVNAGLIPDPATLRQGWDRQVTEVFEIATLPIPSRGVGQYRGKEGIHTEHLVSLLNTMQSVARFQPEATW